MTIQQFIEKAIKGGWKAERTDILLKDGEHIKVENGLYFRNGGGNNYVVAEILLDPEAWKAVGKVEGIACDGTENTHWHVPRCSGALQDNWGRSRMREMVEALCNGKTIEQYLETL